MSQHQSTDEQKIITLAQQGDPKMIAVILNRRLAAWQVSVRVAWKDAYLGVLLEGISVADPEIIKQIKTSLAQLKLESVKGIKIYGRQLGQITPEWYEEIEIETAAPSDSSVLLLADWLSQGVGIDNSNSSLIKAELDSIVDECKFLRFYFSLEDTALLPLSSVKEVLNLPTTEILPVPHMPDCILGIYNCRGEMLWLVDLAKQLGFNSHQLALMQGEMECLSLPSGPSAVSWLEQSTLNIKLSNGIPTVTVIVIQAQDCYLGMVVPKVVDIEMHHLEQLQPPSPDLFAANILPFVQGYLTRSSSPVLDVDALIEDSQLQLHQVY